MKDKVPERQWPNPVDARERLVDRIGSDFYELNEQLTTGLQVLLEAHRVSPEARAAVREYMGDVVKGLDEMEAGVVKLAGVPGALEAGYGAADIQDPMSELDPKAHGHLTMASLFEEIRQDTAAAKREDAHGYGYGKEALREILGGTTGAAASGTDKDHDIER